jgi:uncharacterized membrane protein
MKQASTFVLLFVVLVFVVATFKIKENFQNPSLRIPNTKVPEEGIVIKHYTGEREKVAKVINPDYLIFAEKHNVGDSH